ncbi:MAG: hypothetical protein ACYSO4_01035 [Planctomycetota bacterium]
MNDNKLKKLLKQADASAELTSLDAARLASTARGRLRRRKQAVRYGALAAAAMIAVVCVFSVQKYQSYKKGQRIVQLQQEVEELSRRTEQTLALVEKMLERQEQQDIEYRLASYQDPIRKQVDEAAFILVYQADRMMEKYNNKETAIDYYNQVIERFGDTPSAQTARERLSQINNQSNQI